MRYLTRNRVVLALVIVLAGALSPGAHGQVAVDTLTAPIAPVPNGTDWSVRTAAGAKLVYKSTPSLGNLGSAGGLNIPAPGVAGLVVTLVLGGVMANAQETEQRAAALAHAEKVLVPYQAAINQLSLNGVMQAAINNSRLGRAKTLLNPVDANSNTNWLIEVAPEFTFAEDERAIVLDNVVSVFAPGATAKPVYKNVVRVVSDPIAPITVAAGEAAVPAPASAPWVAANGLLLGQVSASLLAESMDLVFAELAAGADAAPSAAAPEAAPRTFRYLEGALARAERASLITTRCNRLSLKTLRGWLMSVPVKSDPSAEPCLAAKQAPDTPKLTTS